MFDIGGFELLLIAIVGLLVIGPERLPETLRTLGLWLGRLRRSFTAVKSEIEKEVGMDEVRRQLHNEAIMEEMQRIEREVKGSIDEARIDPGEISNPPATDSNDAAESSEQETASAQEPPIEPEPEPEPESEIEPPRPPTEAELEASHKRKMENQARASGSGAEDTA